MLEMYIRHQGLGPAVSPNGGRKPLFLEPRTTSSLPLSRYEALSKIPRLRMVVSGLVPWITQSWAPIYFSSRVSPSFKIIHAFSRSLARNEQCFGFQANIVISWIIFGVWGSRYFIMTYSITLVYLKYILYPWDVDNRVDPSPLSRSLAIRYRWSAASIKMKLTLQTWRPNQQIEIHIYIYGYTVIDPAMFENVWKNNLSYFDLR